MALADEQASPPGANEDMGSQLTFPASSTGLCGGFALQPVESSATLVYSDDGLPVDTVSIGESDTFQDDDFRLVFPTGSFFAVSRKSSNR